MLFRHALFSLVLIGNGSALNSRSPIGEISSAADKPDTGRFIIELAEVCKFPIKTAVFTNTNRVPILTML